MNNTRLPLAASAVAASAIMALTTGQSAMAGDGPALEAKTVLSGLELPWDMAFLDDGTMFYTEKCKGLSVLMPSGDVKPILGMADTDGYASAADDLFCDGQAGMNGVAVDPNFAENRTVYVYSSSNLTSPPSNRVVRLTLSEDMASVAERADIVEDIPFKPAATDHPFGDSGAHNGGRIRFHPENGLLYVTTGDTHNGEGPQSPTLLSGKVLRIDSDGNAASDNAPPDGFDPRIYTFGHRNVQGIAFHPNTGQTIVAEHGPWHSDEVTALVKGGNGGWDPRPNVGDRGDCPDGYCGYMPNQMEGMDPEKRALFMPMTDTATYPDAMQPAWVNKGLSQGTGSAVFLTGDQWGDWNGKLAVGIMGIGFGGTPVGQRIELLSMTDDGKVSEITEMPLPMEPGRFRSVVQAPDGTLFVARDEGDIEQIIPN